MTLVNVVAVVSCEDLCILGGRGGGGSHKGYSGVDN